MQSINGNDLSIPEMAYGLLCVQYNTFVGYLNSVNRPEDGNRDSVLSAVSASFYDSYMDHQEAPKQHKFTVTTGVLKDAHEYSIPSKAPVELEKRMQSLSTSQGLSVKIDHDKFDSINSVGNFSPTTADIVTSSPVTAVGLPNFNSLDVEYDSATNNVRLLDNSKIVYPKPVGNAPVFHVPSPPNAAGSAAFAKPRPPRSFAPPANLKSASPSVGFNPTGSTGTFITPPSIADKDPKNAGASAPLRSKTPPPMAQPRTPTPPPMAQSRAPNLPQSVFPPPQRTFTPPPMLPRAFSPNQNLRAPPRSNTPPTATQPPHQFSQPKARFASTETPLIQVHEMSDIESTVTSVDGDLGQMYSNLVGTKSNLFDSVEIKSVSKHSQETEKKHPQVFLYPEADIESQVASMVGSVITNAPSRDLVIALYDFQARSAKELSITRGDILAVRKRQGTWIYGSIVNRGPEAENAFGWTPVSFVAKYSS